MALDVFTFLLVPRCRLTDIRDFQLTRLVIIATSLNFVVEIN